MKKLINSLLGFSLCLIGSAHGADLLEDFYNHTQTFSATFEQVVADDRGSVKERSLGQMIIERPDKFVLEYRQPATQKYISNGVRMWIYDEELEQVTIKTVDEGLGDSPALLISSDKDIRKSYRVQNTDVPWETNFKWVELRAKSGEMTFQKILLGFYKHKLMEMRLHDGFNQITQLKFLNVITNTPIPAERFNFIIPEGVDVIGSINKAG